jgi:hypothetical protein
MNAEVEIARLKVVAATSVSYGPLMRPSVTFTAECFAPTHVVDLLNTTTVKNQNILWSDA